MRKLRVPVALLFLAACAPAFASDVRALAHPAGMTTTTSNSISFLASYVAGTTSASSFSADGRIATFASWSTDLAPNSPNPSFVNVYATDLATGAINVVSHDAASPTTTGNGSSSQPVISGDGRWIAFSSSASNLVAGMAVGNPDGNVFLHDRQTGANLLVSRHQGSASTGGNDSSYSPWVSTDGRYVAFLSLATDLVAGEILGHPAGTDLFLFDRLLGTTVLASRSAAAPNRTGNGAVVEYVASADGSGLAFTSLATDLVNAQVDSNANFDVHLFDRVTNTTSLVSRAASSPATTGNSFSFEPSISADGRFIAFTSYANDLVAGMLDPNGGFPDVFLFDRLSGANTLVSHFPGASNTTADSGSLRPRISADGSAVTFMSLATGLVPGQSDSNGASYDVFAYDRSSGINTLVSRSTSSASQTGNAESLNPVISADGGRISFESRATDLVPGQADVNNALDVFVWDRASGKTVLVSRTPSAPGTTGNADSTAPMLSADGNLVAFNSLATDLVPSDSNGTLDAFIFRQVSFGLAGSFFPLTPCRLFDTRSGPTGPVLAAFSTRDFAVTGVCGIPLDAASLSLNVTVTQQTGAGLVDVFPAGLATPPTAIVSFRPGRTRANNATVSLGGTPSGTVTVRNASTGSVDVILDVNGYFR